MKTLISALALAGISTSAWALEPIPGSITFGGQPTSKLQKAPVGSSVTHDFFNTGNHYRETYLIQPDRSLKLVRRSRSQDN
jgi:hypothetical protein